MRYKHIETGAIIDSPSKIIGKAWKRIDEAEQEETENPTEKYIEEEIDLEEMTKEQLISFAKEQKIEINGKDTKAVIIETIAKAFE